ncbi:hypothetical protein RYA05_05070 [Pseudomonas syringae pv. actinidiae]|nr:hypothetical protein [Pseudomonas syringae pv. actinidiae]
MSKMLTNIAGKYQQVKIMSIMVAEAHKIMKAYPEDKIEAALSSPESMSILATEIYPQMSESVKKAIPEHRFVDVIVATRKGYMKKKKNKKLLAQ